MDERHGNPSDFNNLVHEVGAQHVRVFKPTCQLAFDEILTDERRQWIVIATNRCLCDLSLLPWVPP